MSRSKADADPLYSPHILELITVANEFCLFTERVEEYPLDEIIDYYRKILPLLYLKASLMPEIIPDEEMPERFVSEQEWETVFNDLRNKFGKDDEFYFIDHSDPADVEPWKGSLADHLADVFQDLKDFIMFFQKNTHTAQQNAVNVCNMLFRTHWGERLSRAHYVLHQIRYRKALDEDFI